MFYVNFPYGNPYSAEYGRHPALVISNNYNNCFAPTVNIIPITSVKRNKKYHVHLPVGNGLQKDSWLMCEKIMTVPKNELKAGEWIGIIRDKAKLDEITEAIKVQIS